MLMDLIANRRSIRRFTADKVEPQKMERLKEAALRAPSSRGVNPWEFIKVESMIAIGHPAESKPPHPKEELQNDKLHLNQFGKPD